MASKQQQQYTLSYLTVPAEEHEQIHTYVNSHFGERALTFYGSFLNYCIGHAGAKKNKSVESKALDEQE